MVVFFFHICRNINNGVYRAGFATSQEAYDVAVRDVFNALDKVTKNILHKWNPLSLHCEQSL